MHISSAWGGERAGAGGPPHCTCTSARDAGRPPKKHNRLLIPLSPLPFKSKSISRKCQREKKKRLKRDRDVWVHCGPANSTTDCDKQLSAGARGGGDKGASSVIKANAPIVSKKPLIALVCLPGSVKEMLSGERGMMVPGEVWLGVSCGEGRGGPSHLLFCAVKTRSLSGEPGSTESLKEKLQWLWAVVFLLLLLLLLLLCYYGQLWLPFPLLTWPGPHICRHCIWII